MKIENDTKFGFCRGCQKWHPRGELRSTNILIYGEGVDNIEDQIRLRLCEPCHAEQKKRWLSDNGKSLRWEPTLIEARHIRINPELAEKCDFIEFDESQEALLAAGG